MKTKRHLENLSDIRRGLGKWQICLRWSYIDLIQGYRRSSIGSVWLSINLLVFSLGMAGVFSILWKTSPAEFLPYVIVGTLLWQLISGCLVEGANALIQCKQHITNSNFPIFAYIIKYFFQKLWHLAHTIPVAAIVVFIFGDIVQANVGLLLAALMLTLFLLVPVVSVLSIIAVRYRDAPMILQNLVQVTFFCTPVFWKYEHLGTKTFIADVNPIYWYLNLFRYAFGVEPYHGTLLKACILPLLAWIIFFSLWLKYRQRIFHWI